MRLPFLQYTQPYLLMNFQTTANDLQRKYGEVECRQAAAKANIDTAKAELYEAGFSDSDIEVVLESMAAARPAAPGGVKNASDGCLATTTKSSSSEESGAYRDFHHQEHKMTTPGNQSANDDAGVDKIEGRTAYLRSLGKFTTEEEDDIREQWRTAEDWEGFINLNRAFLRGESKLSCYHMGPTFEETDELAPILIRLHDYGILTFESQPTGVRGPYEENCSCCKNHQFVQKVQRPFVSFMLPQHSHEMSKDALSKFLVQLMIDDNFYTTILKIEGWCRFGSCRKKQRLLSNFTEDSATHLVKIVSTRMHRYHCRLVTQES